MSRGLVNGIGGEVRELGDAPTPNDGKRRRGNSVLVYDKERRTIVERKWPDEPSTPHDIIACHFRNWGWNLAHRTASEILQELQKQGFHVCKLTD
jgi:hypothetical protein